MLKNLKITSCAFTLYLFGLTLMTVSPVDAQNNEIEQLKATAEARYNELERIRKIMRDQGDTTAYDGRGITD